jgi:type IX secretion system PorP/SprF family membrane protein
MKKLSIIFICSSIACNVLGQQDMGYSQNMFNQMSINPGYAGSMDMIGLNFLQRLQWLKLGIKGAPTSTVFSANAPFTLFQRQHGVGLTIINNNVAFTNDLNLKLSYAYRSKMKFGDGKIGFGASVGLINSTIDLSQLKLGYTGSGDDLPTGKSKPVLDLGLGVFYNTEKLYMGISATHLFAGKFDYSSAGTKPPTATYYYIPHYYVTAGYTYQLSNPMLQLEPSFFIQTVGTTTTLNFNTNIVYNNHVWGGISYRAGQALTGLFGIELSEGIRFGIAYDYETSELNTVSSGSLEVAVIYNFKLKKEKLPQKFKSIRFL